MRSICFIFFLIIPLYAAIAVKAPPYPVKVRQPDGSIITVFIRGDEFYHTVTSADGRVLSRDRKGYFRHTTAPTAAEAAAIRGRNIMRLQTGGAPATFSPTAFPRTVKALVIPVEFEDLGFSSSSPAEHFHSMLNLPGYSENGGTGSAKDYFEANMPGYRFSFDVTQPVKLSHSYTYYGENDLSTPSVITYDMRLLELVEEACTLANASVDFSGYDMNGDGKADFIFFYLAGYNEAESGDEYAIWPQTGNASQEGIRVDGVTVGMFGCASELSGSDLGIDGGGIPSGIGTFCHEFGHFLGLVDLYDTDYGSGGMSNCLWGKLSLMDEGNYNNSGRTPPYFCAIDRELVGEVNYINLTVGETCTLSPIQANGDVIRVPTVNSGEYYLMENRSAEKWDSYIEGAGMVVYHIDKSQNNVDGITAYTRWMTNLVNTYAAHECADLVEAFPQAGHISQVFFPGQAGITELSAAGDPAFIAWDGTPTGIRLSNIMHYGGNITFDVMEDVSEILLSPLMCRIEAFQNKAIMTWETGRPGNYSWAVSWKEAKPDAPVMHDTTMANRYTFDRLYPRTEYMCSIYHVGRYDNGDTAVLRFSTSALTSPYPYILLRRYYEKGDTLEMVLNNITEEYSSVAWYINGFRAISDRYVFRDTGEYEIKVILEYSSDGTQETIVRKLNVTDAYIRDDEEY